MVPSAEKKTSGARAYLESRPGQDSVLASICGVREEDSVRLVGRPRREIACTAENAGRETSVERIWDPYFPFSMCHAQSINFSRRRDIKAYNKPGAAHHSGRNGLFSHSNYLHYRL